MIQVLRSLDIWFYALNVQTAIIMTLSVILLWAILHTLMAELNQKVWAWINGIGLLLTIIAVCYATLFRSGYGRELILQPFYTFERAKHNIEAYRDALMNAILFVPIGLTVPHILPPAWKNGKRFLMTVLIALTFSAVLEISQYLFSLGTSETDDVICNTVGTALGALHFLLAHFLCRSAEKKHI